ncbi:DUF952 domain-containing protein [Palleronia abyssalis]|uniref:DUF952 domain-containing protein n=1 Tax=Palleronia abyssalis TaxID=1501240 RepID=A0A2R8BTY7_9RHOB|nr:DUF952 domain-containing protein [Palleronia abyssalis]SPJ23639.1 hypothetical protein PAA8504_01452 [Palleronia abyssalis]
MRIYKVFRTAEWRELDEAGETQGAPVDLKDGFIHFSTKDQLGGTLAKHFPGEHGLTLAAVETGSLGDDLRWEEARDGAQFPHLYRALKRDEVVWHTELPRDGVDTLTLGDE